jgi:hypothetical protein
MKLATIEPIEGEFGRCHVHSQTEVGVKYLVDLFEYRGNAWCSCDQFKFRCQPALDKGAEPHYSLQCKHIAAAKVYFADRVIELLLKIEERKKGAF